MKTAISLIVIIGLIVLGVYFFTSSKSQNEASVVSENDTMTDVESVELPTGSYTVDTENSTFTWTSTSVIGGQHVGTIPMSGEIVVTEESASGDIIFDVTNITSDTDLLTNHLLSDDFFAVDTYPEARLVVTDVANGVVTGELTIRDVTQTVSTPVTVQETDAGVVLRGDTVLDRTDFGIVYNSNSVFSNLGDSAVRDDIDIVFSLILTTSTSTETVVE